MTGIIAHTLPAGPAAYALTPLLILAITLLLAWLWALWQRDGRAAGVQSWSYVLLLGSITCLVMAAGIWIRQLMR